MKHFIVELTYTVPVEQIGDTVTEHRSHLQIGFDRGWLLATGPKVPRTGGIIIARAPSLEELQAFFADDPYQKQNLATYRFVEFDPTRRQPFLDDWATS